MKKKKREQPAPSAKEKKALVHVWMPESLRNEAQVKAKQKRIPLAEIARRAFRKFVADPDGDEQ